MEGHAHLRQDGRLAALGPGDFALYDTTRPYDISFLNDYRMLVVMFPRTMLRLPTGRAFEVTARQMSGRNGLGALLSPVLAGLADETTHGLEARVHLSDAVLELIAACFSSSIESPFTGSRRDSLLASVKSYIDSRLDDPELDASSIACAHHISGSYLQKVFAGEPLSVAAYIRDRRLSECRRDLTDPSKASRSVAAVGARWGFQDASHFSRLFRHAYDMTPGGVPRCRLRSGSSADLRVSGIARPVCANGQHQCRSVRCNCPDAGGS